MNKFHWLFRNGVLKNGTKTFGKGNSIKYERGTENGKKKKNKRHEWIAIRIHNDKAIGAIFEFAFKLMLLFSWLFFCFSILWFRAPFATWALAFPFCVHYWSDMKSWIIRNILYVYTFESNNITSNFLWCVARYWAKWKAREQDNHKQTESF